MKAGSMKKLVGRYFAERVDNVLVPEIPEYILTGESKEIPGPPVNGKAGFSGRIFFAASVFLCLAVLFHPFSSASQIRMNGVGAEETELIIKGINIYIDHFEFLIKKELN